MKANPYSDRMESGISCNLNGGHCSPEIGGLVRRNISNMLKDGWPYEIVQKRTLGELEVCVVNRTLYVS